MLVGHASCFITKFWSSKIEEVNVWKIPFYKSPNNQVNEKCMAQLIIVTADGKVNKFYRK